MSDTDPKNSFDEVSNTINKWYTVYTALITVYSIAIGVYHAHKHPSKSVIMHVLLWALVPLGVFFAGWTGYLLRSLRGRLNPLYYGFRMMSFKNTLEIDENDRDKHVAHIAVKVTAGADDLMTYPLRYRWNGDGQETKPIITGKRQSLFAATTEGGVHAIRYTKDISPQGRWYYYFIALTPPLSVGDKPITIQYTQHMAYGKGEADKHLGHYSLNKKKLTLRVVFPPNGVPDDLEITHTRFSWLLLRSRTKKIDGWKYYKPSTRTITWTKKTKRDHHYCISWDWDKKDDEET